MALPESLKIELIQTKAAPEPGSTDDKVADWAAGVTQLRQIAQWVVGGSIASIFAIFATTALARIGQMTWANHPERIAASIAGLGLAVVAVAVIFAFGVRVVAPSGLSLEKLAKGTDSTSARARTFLFELNGLNLDQTRLAQVLASTDDDWRPWIVQMRRTLGFVVVRTRFRELMWALIGALAFGIPASLLFVWAANPPEGYNVSPTEEVTITFDAAGRRTGHQVTTRRPKSGNALSGLP